MSMMPSQSHLLVALFSLHLLLLLVCKVDGQSFCEAEGWQQVWSDEFDGPELNASVWTKDVGDRHDSETRHAKALKENVWVENGSLVLRSNGTWEEGKWHNVSSGAVDSHNKQSWKGPTRVCVRAKLPGGPHGKGTGIWPAHWLMPNDPSCWPCHGEIDIMEMINGDGRLHGTYHWCWHQTCGGVNDTHGSRGGTTKMPEDWSTEWHEFAVEYGTTNQDALLQFALDGKVYHKVAARPWSSPLVFPEVPYYAILNTAVGGPWAKPPDEQDSSSLSRRLLEPLQHTQLPTYHLIDWIRVAQPSKRDDFTATDSFPRQEKKGGGGE